MQPGIPLALASAVLFGASTPFAKLLLGSVDPWLMAGLLYVGAGLGRGIFHVMRGAFQLPDVEATLHGRMCRGSRPLSCQEASRVRSS